MSSMDKTVPKKVTKIIRKDGIIYRPAGGTAQPEKTPKPVLSKTPTSPPKPAKTSVTSSQGKKRTLGKVIKRADGTKIVVVDGKIVKTMKADTDHSSAPLKSEERIENSSKLKSSYDEALSPLTDISADELELPPELPNDNDIQNNPEEVQSPDQNATSSVLSIKRTITFNQRSSPAPLLEKPKSLNDDRSSSPFLTKSFDVKKGVTDRKAYRPSHSTYVKPSYVKRPHYESRGRQSSKDVGTNKSRDHLETNRYKDTKEVSQSSKRVRRSRSPRPRRTRSPSRRSRSPTHSRGSGKYRSQKRPKGRSRSKSPKLNSSERRSLSPKVPAIESKLPQDAQSSLTSLLSQESSNCSKENILNLIQKQAEDMLQAQHDGPIDEDKKKKLREAMESILEKRGLITGINRKTRKESLLRSASSDSSDGRESPEILKKLHEKYNTSAEASTEVEKTIKEPLDMEAISPCIDNISVASNEQIVSDVSHSDMEMSDEESKNDNEDGKTPAYRKRPDIIDEHAKESSSQLIQIKLGKDEDEEAFQALAARVDELKSSADVQDLIQAIESRIKSYLSENMDPSNLEKKIKRYQKLVAKVVIEAETIKEKEEDDKVTYHTHRRSKSKELKSRQPEVDSVPEATISYPMPAQELRQPWLHQTPPPQQNFEHGNPQTPLLHNVQEPVSEPSDYEKIHAQYVSQRIGYHVCLLCMTESTNESHFQKHLNSKRHHDAVLSKIRKLNTATNTKKFKKHDLVIKCQLCDVICHGQTKYNEHANHRSHHALVQAYIKIGRVVPEPEILHDHEDQIREQLEVIQESDTPAVGREYMSVKTVKDCDDNIMDVYHCSLCKTNCNSEIQVEKHVRSKKHYLIYVKVTQPEVNVQVNASEHKKRRETTKKIVNAMKTIKQMEEMMERNRDRMGTDSTMVTNKNQESTEMPPIMVNRPPSAGAQIGNSGNPSYSSGSGPVPFRYPNQHSSPDKMKSQNVPYYRDPTSRLSSSQASVQLGSDIGPSPSRGLSPSQYNSKDSRSNSHGRFSMVGPSSSSMNFNSTNQEQFTHHDPGHGGIDTFRHGMYDSQSHPEPGVMRNNINNSISIPVGYSKVSSASTPHSHVGPYSSVLNSSTGRQENPHRPMGSGPYNSAKKSEESTRFAPFNQSGQFNEHQSHVSPLYKKQAPSNSHIDKELHMGPGSSYVDTSSSNYNPQPEQNFHSKHSWMGPGKNPTNQNFGYQSHQSQQVNLSKNLPQSHHGIYSEQTSGETSWPNRVRNTGQDPASNASVQLSDQQVGNTFSSAAPTSQPYLDQSRNTYSSAYNRLKQGETQHNPAASSYSGPTFSHKPTYSGVYTNVRRG